MMDYSVRMATIADIPQLVSLRVAYLKDEFPDTDFAQETLDAVNKQLPDYFASHMGRDCFVFCAETAAGELVSIAVLVCIEKPANLTFPNGKSGEVLSVYTKPEWRGKGCASALMKLLLAQAKSEGLDIVKLSASAMGKPIYEKLGFQIAHSKFTEMKYPISR